MQTSVLTSSIVALLAVLSQSGPSAAAAERPNILFCIADDASYPHMGAYGTEWVKTPGFDRVAKQGLLFTRAYTPNAKCAPSRACILTGRNTWQLKEACNHIPFFPAEFKTYAEALGEHGYHVGKTAKGWAPRVLGNGKIFDEYIYANEDTRNFYERYMKGEKLNAGWVNKSDFEEGPLD